MQQSKATKDTKKDIKRCLDYLTTFTNGTITYAPHDVVLWACMCGAFLVEDRAKSRVGRHYFLGDFIEDVSKAQPKHNGHLHFYEKS